MHKFGGGMLAVLLALNAGCTLLPTDAVPDAVALSYVGSFSGHPEGEKLPPGWQPWILSRFKRQTEYRLTNDHGRTVMRARAQNSASGLVHPLQLDPVAYPLLHWHWKVDALIASADNTQKHLEDSPVRLMVSFDGDISKIPLHDRMIFNSIRVLTNQQLPYATLIYIWENHAPRETLIPNHHTSRVKMIVAESGRDKLGAWQQFTRNIINDYRRAFGEEPGKITAVGIMTDTDNTGGNARAWYGDIAFRKAPEPQAAVATQ